jgi:23S rRNA (cytosine1962-C5)-methyltransferase
VWRLGVTRGDRDLEAGREVALTDSSGIDLGRGIYDPSSPIAVRVWSVGAPIDEALFAARIEHAFALRARLFQDDGTTAYRLLHGEGDRVPGIVVDRYAHVAVMRADGAGAEALVVAFLPPLASALERMGVHTLALRRTTRRQTRGTVALGAAHETDAPSFERLAGGDLPPTVAVAEHGVPFLVDLIKGQKTGAFLDQRENRRRVGKLAQGRTVLNLFSYAGGFSLFAVHGGATKVTSIDTSAAAHATAQASFRLAGHDPSRHDFVAADAFDFLEQAKRKGLRWDLVVSDPPSFAPSEKALPRALSAYRALHRACAEVLAPRGILCASSCSSHVDATAFASTLDDAALGRSDLSLLELYGPPPDHPTLASWPEGRYLKSAVLQ